MPVISRTITALDIAMPQRRRPDLFDFRPQPSPAVHTRCPCSTRSPEAFEKGTKSLLSGTRRAFSRGMARAPPAACGVRTAAASAVADIHRPCHHDQSPPHTRTNSRVTFSEGSARPATAAASALFETAHRRAIFQKGRSPLSVRSARSSPANRSTGPAVGSSGRICRPISAPLVLDKVRPLIVQSTSSWTISGPTWRGTHSRREGRPMKRAVVAVRGACDPPPGRPPRRRLRLLVHRRFCGRVRADAVTDGSVVAMCALCLTPRHPFPRLSPPRTARAVRCSGLGDRFTAAWGGC